jgi:radical SAM protein with 4Fe4S-binding SPASM domain
VEEVNMTQTLIKAFKSPNYNFVFNTDTGFFARWGKTEQDDPEYSPFGPEILDIEIGTKCSRACSWCYKSNQAMGKNMSFETFKIMFDKFPKQLTQIAFGIGDIDGNPDLWRIMNYCREHGVIPNITINGERMTDDLYDRLASTCGAVAVSLYNRDTCFNAVAELSKRMKQVNIHCLLSLETYRLCFGVTEDIRNDPRLKNLNAIVFLWLKPKGDRNTFRQITESKYRILVGRLLDAGVRFGFDSCTASNFLKVTEGNPKWGEFKTMSEPCESTLFSYYINVDGRGFPCSFSEGTPEYAGVDVAGCKNFIKDVWNAPETKRFRSAVMNNKDCNGCRMCPIYDLKCV